MTSSLVASYLVARWILMLHVQLRCRLAVAAFSAQSAPQEAFSPPCLAKRCTATTPDSGDYSEHHSWLAVTRAFESLTPAVSESLERGSSSLVAGLPTSPRFRHKKQQHPAPGGAPVAPLVRQWHLLGPIVNRMVTEAMRGQHKSRRGRAVTSSSSQYIKVAPQ